MSEKRYVISELDPISVLDMNTGDTFPIADGSGFVETIVECLNALHDENEQLKQDNNALIHLLENQSMIIQELHSKLLEYQVKEPIVLTKEDLNLMGKAIGYYTHGRCPE